MSDVVSPVLVGRERGLARVRAARARVRAALVRVVSEPDGPAPPSPGHSAQRRSRGPEESAGA